MANILENQMQLNLNNISLREQVLSMVRDLPEAGAGGGQYVWKKYEAGLLEIKTPVTNFEFASHGGNSTSSNTKIYAADSYTYDKNSQIFTLVNPTLVTFRLDTGSSDLCGKYVIPSHANNPSTSGSELFRVNDSESFSYTTVTPVHTTTNGDLITMETGATNFLDYVVSDSETAYPDGAVQDGYWYEKADGGLTAEMFGYSKYAVDTIAYSSDTVLKTTTLQHSLGEIPRMAILSAPYEIVEFTQYITRVTGIAGSKNNKMSGSILCFFEEGDVYMSNLGGASISTGNYNTENNLRFDGTTMGENKLKSGVEYTLITMA